MGTDMEELSEPKKGRRKLASRIIRRVDLHSVLVADLRQMIEQGELRAGMAIVETDLCEQFGVSRTPMREALKVLSSEGLVQLRRNRTPVVAPIDPAEIAAIFETVGAIERRAAFRACEIASEAELSHLDAMHAELIGHHKVDDRRSYAIQNRDIHTAIVRMAKNPVMLNMHAMLSTKIVRARSTLTYDPARWRDAITEHDGFMDALRRRAADEAAFLLEDHVLRTGEAIVEKLQERAARTDNGGR